MNQYLELTELDELLYRIDASMTAADAHGTLCGMICARGAVELSEWVDLVIEEQEPGSDLLHDVVHKLSALHQWTLETMNDPEGGFRMLLLDDDDPLPERVRVLATWCHGFVCGLAEGGITEQTMSEDGSLPGDIKEMIKDLVEISNVDPDIDVDSDDAAANEDEVAYMEVEEFVRVCVSSIYEELQPLQSTQTIH